MNISKDIQDQIILSRSKLWTPEVDKLLRRWKKQIEIRKTAHYDISNNWSKVHYGLGVQTSGIVAGVTSGVFSTFRVCPIVNGTADSRCAADEWIRLALGIIGIMGIVLTGGMTVLNPQSLAESHKTAANRYDSLYGTIESLLVMPGSIRGDPVTTLQQIRTQYDDIIKISPTLPKEYQSELSFTTINTPQQQSNNSTKKGEQSKTTVDPNLVNLVTSNPVIARDKRNTDTIKRDASILKGVIMDSRSEDKTNDDNLKKDKLKKNATKNIPLNKSSNSVMMNIIPSPDVVSSSETTENIEAYLNQRNNFDSDDDQEVCLAFDLDQMVAINNSMPLVMADTKYMAQRDKQMQKSLLHSIAFELQRMDEHDINSPRRYSPRKRPTHKKTKRRKTHSQIPINSTTDSFSAEYDSDSSINEKPKQKLSGSNLQYQDSPIKHKKPKKLKKSGSTGDINAVIDEENKGNDSPQIQRKKGSDTIIELGEVAKDKPDVKEFI